MSFKHTEFNHGVLVSKTRFIAIYVDNISIFNKYDNQLKKL